MQYNLLSVELLVHQHVEVVLFFFNVDRHIHAPSSNRDRDGLSIILVLKEESKLLVYFSQFIGHKSELNSS